MSTTQQPILYSFRRCPYAMRARLALLASGIVYEHREIILSDKPAELLEASPKGTVPVLVLPNTHVIEQSLDIMKWALAQNDPEGWLPQDAHVREATDALILQNDTTFKAALDRYKYPWKYEGEIAEDHRANGSEILRNLDTQLAQNTFLFANTPGLADMALLPFVRQFAHVDRDWFYAQSWPHLIRWLDVFLDSENFQKIMQKFPRWISTQ